MFTKALALFALVASVSANAINFSNVAGATYAVGQTYDVDWTYDPNRPEPFPGNTDAPFTLKLVDQRNGPNTGTAIEPPVLSSTFSALKGKITIPNIAPGPRFTFAITSGTVTVYSEPFVLTGGNGGNSTTPTTPAGSNTTQTGTVAGTTPTAGTSSAVASITASASSAIASITSAVGGAVSSATSAAGAAATGTAAKNSGSANLPALAALALPLAALAMA
ncbi:uncharacterized protein EV422DRAFT_195332 [Fimicolochytrium jonesii]|uniref:uncharacterized protein n=1 Tax=Fimicolochytrium jonesii TaxID=1396493 RepID=UPI0022FE541B|nr:uncharacterized protein EV422DRAFT_195332 [Fimicolochytrium jonesii]KAI8818236.1 hypothetical protein EV422DRAFT_195332 [Fimicolochytrium jonesii]